MVYFRKMISNEKLQNSSDRLASLEALAADIRLSTFETILSAGSGHLGGNSSSVELMTALYFGGYIQYDPYDDKNPNRDIVLVRGHEGPLRYKIFSLIGYIPEEQLDTYRQLGSNLQGHEDMWTTPGVDLTPSGSLGMLLSYGVGAALNYRESDMPNKTVVFLGDGEEQEGNVSEAARSAAHIGLGRLICIIDKNHKQLSGRTDRSDSASDLATIWRGYGWEVFEIENGNDMSDVIDTYDTVFQDTDGSDRPKLIIANTTKGLGLPGVEEHFSGAHTLGAYRNNDGVEYAIQEQKDMLHSTGWDHERICRIAAALLPCIVETGARQEPSALEVSIPVADASGISLEGSQVHYFAELRKQIENTDNPPHLYVLTPDFVLEPLVRDVFKFPQYGTYVDNGIREQHTIAMAHGISTMNPNSRIINFFGDAFMYRSMDQLNAAVQGGSKAIIFSERAGITQERNGSTHQTVGQPGAIFAMPDVHFKEPGDVQDLYNILDWFFTDNPGWVYLRTHSNETEPLERDQQDMHNIEFFRVHDEDGVPQAVLVSSGLTLAHSIAAAKRLYVEEGIKTRVINVIDPKSLDGRFTGLLQDGAPVYTVYNGSPHLLQMAVASSVMEDSNNAARPSKVLGYGFKKGTSGKVAELEKHLKLDSQGIFDNILRDLREN